MIWRSPANDSYPEEDNKFTVVYVLQGAARTSQTDTVSHPVRAACSLGMSHTMVFRLLKKHWTQY